MGEIILELEGLNCASCADKIEQSSRKLEGVDSASLNFVNKKFTVAIKDVNKEDQIVESIEKIVHKLEPDVKVTNLSTNNLQEKDKKHYKDTVKKDLLKVIVGAVLFALPYILNLQGRIRFFGFLLAYLFIGYRVIIIAGKNIVGGSPFDENFLMTVASLGAFIIGEHPEAVAVMLFYQVGEFFENLAVNHSRRSITSLMDIRPDYANLIRDNEEIKVDPSEVNIGDYIIVKPGEKVPLDGIVVEGESSLDTSNITGESVPRSIKEGEEIISGVVNNQGLLKIKTSKEFKESTISKVLDLVENASSKKAPTENFITKFARYYTPVVVFIALGIGIIPPIFFNGSLSDWSYRAFVFLVISCPCALVMSIPLGFFGGIGASSKEGVLVKGGNYLEGLNHIDTIVFDKTGTITKGTFKVTDIRTYGDYSKEEILELAAYGEFYSNHPIGKSIIDEYGKDIDSKYIKDYEEISGKGISVEINNMKILLGNKELLRDNNIKVNEEESIGTIVYLAKEKKHIGTIMVSDELKDNIVDDLARLKKEGIKKTIMLSGDNERIAKKVAEIAGIDKAYGGLLPQDKVELFEKILEEKTSGKMVAFVGDGVNDAPVLARADIGIGMGALGSDAAIEASDIVIMTDEISKISSGINIAKRTKRIVSQNIGIALGLKLIVLGLGAFGLATMWQAVFADVGVTVIAVLNSIRVLKTD